jgi:hypothetical protein
MGAQGSAEGAVVRRELAPGNELAKIKASYIGSLPLATMNRSPNFVLQAAKKIGDGKSENVPVQMQITDTGVFITHATTNTLLAEVALADISNVSQVSASKVAYLRRDRKTGFLACHLFYFPKHATRVIEVLNQACAANVRLYVYMYVRVPSPGRCGATNIVKCALRVECVGFCVCVSLAARARAGQIRRGSRRQRCQRR